MQDARFGFRQGYMLELIELNDPPTVLQSFVFPLPPQRYTLTEPYTGVETGTEANTVVVEEYGSLTQDIQIEGTFGLRKRSAGQSGELTGNEHFAAFRELFRTYGDRKKDPSLAHKTELRWHAFREDDHFVVTVKQFEMPRDAKMARIHYVYRVSMKAIAYADEPLTETVDDETGNFFDDALRSISTAVNDALAAFQVINTNIVQARRKLQNIDSVVLQAAGVITAASNMLRGASDLIAYPLKLAVSVTETIAQAADDLESAIDYATLSPVDTLMQTVVALRRLEGSFNRIASFPDRFAGGIEERIMRLEEAFAGARRLTQRDITDGAAGADAGTAISVAGGSAAENGAGLAAFSSVRSIEVDRSTSLSGLAGRYGIDPLIIVLLNDLRPPYFAPGGGPGVLGPGDTVLIPVTSDTGASTTAGLGGASYLTAEELLYGSDWAIDEEHYRRTGRFELLVDTLHGALDAQIVRGVKCVVQGMHILIETPRGDTIYMPTLGVFRTVGVRGTIANLLLASLRLREAVLSDPRVEKIEKSSVVIDGDVLYQEVTPRLVGGRSDATLVRPLGRVSGG